MLLGKRALARLRGRKKHVGERWRNGRKSTAECAVEGRQRVLIDSVQHLSVAPRGIAAQGTTVVSPPPSLKTRDRS